MQEAALVLQGQHDYKSFCSNPQMKKSTVRIVDSIDIRRRRDYIYLTFHGTGFLQNMVRILVGTLLEVGKGSMTAQQVSEILEARDRRLPGRRLHRRACASSVLTIESKLKAPAKSRRFFFNGKFSSCAHL